MKRHLLGWSLAFSVVGLSAPSAFADIPYFNGFETAGNVNDFYNKQSQPGGGITRVASGTSALGYTAASGGFYAEIQNVNDSYSTGFGIAGVTLYGSTVSAHSTGFQESVDIYIDTAKWLPGATIGTNFVISSQPTTASGGDASNDFTNFIFSVSSPGHINVSSSASPALTSITTSGWYTFATTFVPGTAFVENDLSVLNSVGATLATAHQVSTLPSGQLGGSGRTFFGPWQNDFAGNVIAIDNLQTSLVPEPVALALAPIGLMLLRRRSRR